MPILRRNRPSDSAKWRSLPFRCRYRRPLPSSSAKRTAHQLLGLGTWDERPAVAAQRQVAEAHRTGDVRERLTSRAAACGRVQLRRGNPVQSFRQRAASPYRALLSLSEAANCTASRRASGTPAVARICAAAAMRRRLSPPRQSPSFSWRAASRRLSTSSSILPSITSLRLCTERLIRWSVIRLCG